MNFLAEKSKSLNQKVVIPFLCNIVSWTLYDNFNNLKIAA